MFFSRSGVFRRREFENFVDAVEEFIGAHRLEYIEAPRYSSSRMRLGDGLK